MASLQNTTVTGTLSVSGAPTFTTAVPVASGGTGSTTAAGALSNLGGQAALVSGTNIKTVGGTTLLGSGDVGFPVTSVNGLTGAVTISTGSSTTYGDIGTYVLAASTDYPCTTAASVTTSPGVTVAGSTLIRDASTANNQTSYISGFNTAGGNSSAISGYPGTSISASGTWRLMTYLKRSSNATYYAPVGLWVRIS